jgi:hypothetical protein
MAKALLNICFVFLLLVLWAYGFVQSFWFYNQSSDIAIAIGIIVDTILVFILLLAGGWGIKKGIKLLEKEMENGDKKE